MLLPFIPSRSSHWAPAVFCTNDSVKTGQQLYINNILVRPSITTNRIWQLIVVVMFACLCLCLVLPAYTDATVFFLHLFCPSCPMDLQCPIKAVDIYQSSNQLVVVWYFRHCELRLRSTPRYRLVCICFPTPGSGLGLSRCLGPAECLHSFIHSLPTLVTVCFCLRLLSLE